MSREQPGNVLSEQRVERGSSREPVAIRVAEAPAASPLEGAGDPDAEARAFVRFCYRRRSVDWPELYDEMCAVAARGDYRGMDYEQLRSVGIGFALASLPRLAELAAHVIAEERRPQRVTSVA